MKTTKTDDKLNFNDTLYKSIVDSSSDWVYIINIHTKSILYMSPSASWHTGYDAQEFVNDPKLLNKIIHPEDEEIWREHNIKYTKDPMLDSHQQIEYRVISKDGATKWFSHICKPFFDRDDNYVGRRVSIRDISEQKAEKSIRESLLELAHFDQLTKLPNRITLADRMQVSMSRSSRHNEILAVCVLDLDSFKPINDTYGHKAGDAVLKEVSARLLNTIREDDTAARVGGDEFVILLNGLKNLNECEKALERIIKEISLPINIDSQQVIIGASIGVAFFPMDGADAETLLIRADMAMYQTKQAGKHNYGFYDHSYEQRIKANESTIKKIKKGLATGQFCLYYQPKVDCKKGTVVGLEALIRWNHPTFGLMEPDQFLSLIENNESIVELGEFVLKTALAQIVEWRKLGISLPVSVNISAKHLKKFDFVEQLKETIAAANIDQNQETPLLEIELTEISALENIGFVSELIKKMKEIGVGFSIDDFGTGQSSLFQFKQLCADSFKMDNRFINSILTNPNSEAIVECATALTKTLSRKLIAEGVESAALIQRLLQMECDVMQGYEISRPMPASHVSDWIRAFAFKPEWSLDK